MLTKPARYQFQPGRPAQAGFAGGIVCRNVPVVIQCGTTTTCYTVPLAPGNIPSEGKICVTQPSCSGQNPNAGSSSLFCAYFPPIPEVPAVPPTYLELGNYAWTASAHSVSMFDVDCEVAFDMPSVIGVVVGLLSIRLNTSNPERILYGMQFGIGANGGTIFFVVESGNRRTQDSPYVPEIDVFKIRRVGQTVSYLKNDQIIYVSSRPCVETSMSVGSSLFGFGDEIP